MKDKKLDSSISTTHMFSMLTHLDGSSLRSRVRHHLQDMVIRLFLLGPELLYLEEKDLKLLSVIYMLLIP